MAVGPLTRLLPALALLLLVGGCNTPLPPQQFSELSWSNLPPFRLNVARVEVVRQYMPSDTPPHVDTLTPRTLIDSADRWARDRLVAVGNSGVARFIITDASVVEVPLPVNKGLAYAFTEEQSKRYDAHVAVRLEIVNARGYTDGEVRAEASNSRSVAQNATPRDINQVWYLIVQGTMLDLNAQLERNIYTYLRRFLAS
ncbi:MAG TPA: hypothetical protein VKY65_11985 [Alphaproteobacteria bacterium]|nr:hypothetical protein [Alphaproteobacteria bacterium]